MDFILQKWISRKFFGNFLNVIPPEISPKIQFCEINIDTVVSSSQYRFDWLHRIFVEFRCWELLTKLYFLKLGSVIIIKSKYYHINEPDIKEQKFWPPSEIRWQKSFTPFTCRDCYIPSHTNSTVRKIW